MSMASEELKASFKLAMRRFPAAVSVITSADQGRRHGMTATAVTSLSLDPPSLIACINRTTLLHDIMLHGRHFCVNVLRRDQAELSSGSSLRAGQMANFRRWRHLSCRRADQRLLPQGRRRPLRHPHDLHRRGAGRERARSDRAADLPGRDLLLCGRGCNAEPGPHQGRRQSLNI